jgi:hypothetical protein
VPAGFFDQTWAKLNPLNFEPVRIEDYCQSLSPRFCGLGLKKDYIYQFTFAHF